MPEPQTAADVQEYLRSMVGEIAVALHDILGPNDAEGFISIASQRVAQTIAPAEPPLPDQMGAALVEMEAVMGGDFYVAEESPAAIVLGNRICPFGRHVRGRTALCMSTSNILGSVAAQHLGYARVEIQRSIAEGETECRVVVHLIPSPAAGPLKSREYFASPHKK